jgi:hypothetical protein
VITIPKSLITIPKRPRDHDPEIGDHDAETGDHDGPLPAVRARTNVAEFGSAGFAEPISRGHES